MPRPNTGRKTVELDPKSTDPCPRKQLAAVNRMRSLLSQLDDVVAGRTIPSLAAESVDFAQLCYQRFVGRYVASVRLFDRAFADDPKLAEGLAAYHRYNAACSAALAADGEGTDAPAEPAQRATLRGQALAWLRADLEASHGVLRCDVVGMLLPFVAGRPVSQITAEFLA